MIDFDAIKARYAPGAPLRHGLPARVATDLDALIGALECFYQASRDRGHKGGKRRMETLSPQRRSEIARRAANVRWNAERRRQRQDGGDR